MMIAMKLGSSGRSFVAACLVAGLAASGSSCGRKLAPVRPPPTMIDGGLSFSVNYQTFTMRNGLVVVLAPDDESNLVTVDMRYFVGAADEPEGKTGLAHLAEHLTFEAVPEGTSRPLGARLADAALSYNAGTSFDSTHYYSVGLAPSLEALLAAESQRMAATCDQLSDELFTRERAVVLQELAQREEVTSPSKALHALVWGEGHRFARGVGGQDLARLTRDDYCAFTTRHYHPGNATLIIGGKIDAGRTLRLIAKHFDKLAGRDQAPRAVLSALPAPRAPQLSERISVEHPTAMLVFPLSPSGSRERALEEVAALLVAGELERKVSKDSELIDSDLRILGSARQAALALSLSGTAGHKALLEKLRGAVTAALELEPGPQIQQLQAAMFTQLAASHDNMFGRGRLIGDRSQFASDAEYAREAEIYAALTAEELKATGEALFQEASGRAFFFQKQAAQGAGKRYELANVGDSLATELPRRGPLSAGAAGALSFGDLSPSYKPLDFKLRNGLRVILVPRRAQAFFEARFVVPIGSADDPPGRAGTAALTAAMLSPPRRNLDLGDVLMMHLGSFSGSSITSDTTAHTTTFRVRGVPSQAVMHLWRMHVLLESGGHYPKDVEELHEQWSQEERAEKELAADPDVLAEKRKQRLWQALLGKMLGKDYPYLRDRGDERKKITVDDMSAFRDAHYRSNGAVLVVVGGFDKDQIEREIYELWGAWPNAAVPPSKSLPAARPEAGPSYLALERPDTQVSLALAFPARSDAAKDFGAQLVAAELLRDRVAEIRERMAATYGLHLDYMQLAGASFVVVEGRVAPDRGASVLAALGEAWKVDRDGPAQLALEVSRARRRAVQRALAQSSSSAAIADSLAELAMSGGGLADQRKQLAAIAAVTTEQVRAVIQGDLDPARATIAASGPRAREILQSAGAVRVEEVR